MNTQVGILAAALILLVGSSCSSDSQQHSSPQEEDRSVATTTTAAPSPLTEPGQLGVAEIVSVGGSPNDLAVVGDSILTSIGEVNSGPEVPESNAQSVIMVDSTDGTVISDIETANATSLAVESSDAGEAWVVNYPFSYSRIDTDSGELAGPYIAFEMSGGEWGSPIGSIAAADDSVWIISETDGNFVGRVDPQTGEIVSTVTVQEPGAIALSDDAVWVTNTQSASITRIDPDTGDIAAVIELQSGATPTAVSVSNEAVWVGSDSDATVFRIDPSTNSVVEAIVRPQGAGQIVGDIVVDGTSVWFSDPTDNTISRIDSTINSVVDSVVVDGSFPEALAATANGIWVADPIDGTIARIAEVSSGNSSDDEALPIPAGTPPPFIDTSTVYGQDTATAAQACFDGDMLACDLVYNRSESNSPEEEYSQSCGGRAAATNGPPDCRRRFRVDDPVPSPPNGLGTDSVLDRLAQDCFDGEFGACDDLASAAFDSATGQELAGLENYYDYGSTCAHRLVVSGRGSICGWLLPP